MNIFRRWLPVWIRELPQLRFTPTSPDDNFTLISKNELNYLLKDVSPDTAEKLIHDLSFLEYRLMRHFRKLDWEAKYHQNRYRYFQIMFMILAFFATLVGSLIALSVNSNSTAVPVLALLDTIVALLTTYVATIGSRVDSHSLWLQKRQRAEQLRREMFRYLLDLAPYDAQPEGYAREALLAQRAARMRVGEDLGEAQNEQI